MNGNARSDAASKARGLGFGHVACRVCQTAARSAAEGMSERGTLDELRGVTADLLNILRGWEKARPELQAAGLWPPEWGAPK